MSQWRTILKEAFHRTSTFARFLCMLHITDNYIFSPTAVYGPSMLPTLNLSGDLVIVEKISARLGRIGAGDVVCVRSSTDPKKIVMKRVLGMEGDKISYLVDPHNSEIAKTNVVPKGHVWIQGDNIYCSNDSRHYGPVPYGLILGKVFCRMVQALLQIFNERPAAIPFGALPSDKLLQFFFAPTKPSTKSSMPL